MSFVIIDKYMDPVKKLLSNQSNFLETITMRKNGAEQIL